jgi:hypothetical protein
VCLFRNRGALLVVSTPAELQRRSEAVRCTNHSTVHSTRHGADCAEFEGAPEALLMQILQLLEKDARVACVPCPFACQHHTSAIA